MNFPKRDLLYEVYYEGMSNHEADKILGAYIEEDNSTFWQKLGINMQKEGTALSYWRLSYKAVAKWRYKGWPTICALCNRPMDKDVHRWQAHRSLRVNGKLKRNVLTHQPRARCTESNFDEDKELLKHYER